MKISKLKKNLQNAQMYGFMSSGALADIEEELLFYGLLCGM